ncbi:GGDEF domain-containing protein [Telmatospirillum siberiense]|uniref:GGDEF domain-containing protein n=1 Tax=Telmatospirillum siberiense TaxID=382514 RepID=A0A2N3PWJ6_9PROT|nr:GGDEF domain-containing protein [Telmatospirillum siberiense]PKU24770.1 GGDEF domain-containing protein [Telmatospirillum siberiense]
MPDPLTVIERLDHAFQPIVNMATGHCFAYEALLNGCADQGFPDQRAFFDACYAIGQLDVVQLRLWEMATARFAGLPHARGARLFLNIDSRSLDGSDSLPRQIRGLLSQYDVPENAITFQISEPPPGVFDPVAPWVRALKRQTCKIAIDRFGGGVAGFQMLYGVEPEFLKLDQFFIRNVTSDSKKKMLLSNVVATAHLLGIVVVAVGVESRSEFMTCKEVGCDLAQGVMIEGPCLHPGDLPSHYPHVEELSRHDRRGRVGDRKIILDQMAPIPPLTIDDEITAVFDRLRRDTRQTFLPVVDRMGQPLGIVRESNIKNYAYSPFGKDLISNKGLGRKLKDFIVRCPIADVQMPVENIMSIYSGDEEAEGIILVDQMRYVGFLSARSIIRVINEKSLAQARDQNPLTKLPGNSLINQFIAESLADVNSPCAYVYVDFDNFKPFNDKYGFRQGDRAILLFAEMIRKRLAAECFLGHIGGDDFFIGFVGALAAGAATEAGYLLEAFRSDAESFYDAEARAAGCISAADRDGTVKCFPLLSASAVVVEAASPRRLFSADDVSALIAKLKKQAKNAPTKLVSTCLPG